MLNIKDLRQDYKKASLNEADVLANPLAQFEKWFKEAQHAEIYEPNAMTLATSNASGQPSARIVLLKGFNDKGFVWFTNYNSLKGHDLEENNQAALLFFWAEMERQIRIEGKVKKVSRADTEAYFATRPVGSQLGAWASPQSEVIPSREVLEQNWTKAENVFKDKTIPAPEHWGGYELEPHKLEFWQGRSSRMHDRICYTLHQDGWQISRLAP